MRSEPFNRPITCRCVPCLKNKAPVRKVPSGITTTPPPSWAARSMTAWMALVCTMVESRRTPKSVITYCLPSLATSTLVVSLNHASITVWSGQTSTAGFFLGFATPVATSATASNKSTILLIFQLFVLIAYKITDYFRISSDTNCTNCYLIVRI